MSNAKNETLRVEHSSIGSVDAVANNYCWSNYTIGANGWYRFSLYVTGATVVGAGIKTHNEYERVVVTTDYPGDSNNWEITLYNMEDHDVTFDVYAWFG